MANSCRGDNRQAKRQSQQRLRPAWIFFPPIDRAVVFLAHQSELKPAVERFSPRRIAIQCRCGTVHMMASPGGAVHPNDAGGYETIRPTAARHRRRAFYAVRGTSRPPE